jgi:HD superfamily phosphohydrolase
LRNLVARISARSCVLSPISLTKTKKNELKISSTETSHLLGREVVIQGDNKRHDVFLKNTFTIQYIKEEQKQFLLTPKQHSKMYAMEIRDPVHGAIEVSNNEVNILDTPECQRLRAIKQLGFSEFSFPAATHNRYLHSIGVCHLAGRAFDQIFSKHQFSSTNAKIRLRSCIRLAALLHDIGHGPLSHATEEVMPHLSELDVKAYNSRPKSAYTLGLAESLDRKANHEDYTIKYITDSHLTTELKLNFPDIAPINIACLIDKTLIPTENFFIDQNLDFRPILSQLVSSELDVDRMDYLERDSYFCGTNYGHIDREWLLGNLRPHILEDQIFLALNRRALYTFDDYLLSRHHMNLMVYFHHKSIIYEEMLTRYLTSTDCKFFLPAKISDYTRYNDYKLFEHLSTETNEWARRIAERKPYKNLIELHNSADATRPERIKEYLTQKGIRVILASSHVRLSKYHASSAEDGALRIYVIDQYDKWDEPVPIDQSTSIFKTYEEARIIDRIYVDPEQYIEAKSLLDEKHI